MTAAQYLEFLAPEFTDETLRATALEAAIPALNAATLGARYNEALALRAAHLLTCREALGRAGAITAEGEGQLSRSYAVNDSNDLATTGYGRQLAQLLKETITPFTTRAEAWAS